MDTKTAIQTHRGREFFFCFKTFFTFFKLFNFQISTILHLSFLKLFLKKCVAFFFSKIFHFLHSYIFCILTFFAFLHFCIFSKNILQFLHFHIFPFFAGRHTTLTVKRPPPHTSDSNHMNNHANRVRKSWRYDVPIILPGWVRDTGGSWSAKRPILPPVISSSLLVGVLFSLCS